LLERARFRHAGPRIELDRARADAADRQAEAQRTSPILLALTKSHSTRYRGADAPFVT